MTRHARMQGRPALFLPGLDHASIAAQVVLDRILAAEGETRASLGRERYLERMWRVRRRDAATSILGQQRRVGASLRLGPRSASRWTRSRARAVREAFARLYREGLAYRDRDAHQLVPRLPDQPVRPRGRRRPRRRARSGRSATTCSTRRPARPDPERHDQRRHDPPGDAPRRHRRRRPSRRPALRRAGRPAGP